MRARSWKIRVAKTRLHEKLRKRIRTGSTMRRRNVSNTKPHGPVSKWCRRVVSAKFRKILSKTGRKLSIMGHRELLHPALCKISSTRHDRGSPATILKISNTRFRSTSRRGLRSFLRSGKQAGDCPVGFRRASERVRLRAFLHFLPLTLPSFASPSPLTRARSARRF